MRISYKLQSVCRSFLHSQVVKKYFDYLDTCICEQLEMQEKIMLSNIVTINTVQSNLFVNLYSLWNKKLIKINLRTFPEKSTSYMNL